MRNLTMSQLQRLRGLIRKTPALSGVEYALRPHHVEITGPRRLALPLETLARQVAPMPVDRWPAVVDEYFRRSVAAMLDPADGPLEDLIDRLLPRIWPADDPVARNSAARSVAPGLVEVLALDHSDHISVLSDTFVDRHDLGVLRGAAMRNLLARRQAVKVYRHEDTWIVQGDDHTAAGLLILPQLITAVLGERDLSAGVVVAVPAQSTVIFQVQGEGVGTVKQFARRLYDDLHHPISPEAFWWRDGVLTLAGDEDLLETLYRLFDDPREFTRPTEEVLARTYPQLLRPDVRPDPSWWAYARETIPGVLDVLALDLLPDGVKTFHDEHVARHGLDRLREAGLRNLRTVPVEDHDQENGVQWLFGGPHLAATALILDELIERTTGERELPDGALVAIPMRQLLLYHVPRDAGLADAMFAMAETVRSYRAEHPLDTISPHVYWWRDREFVKLTHLRGDGTLAWPLPPDFRRLYRRLCPPEEVERPAELAGPTESIIDGIYPRLWHPADSPEVTYGQELAPGLVSALVYADPESVTFLTDADVARHGGPDRLREVARRNLARDRHDLRPTQEGGLWFVFGGRHLSALVLSLGTLVEAATGTAPVNGVLVSVPNQAILVIRVLTGDDEADGAALKLITAFTGKYYDESATCVSRRVYWWQDGVFDLAPEVSG